MPLAEHTTHQLLLVQEFIRDARNAAEHSLAGYERMRAIVLADLAVELGLAALAAELHLEVGPKPNFDTYLAEIGKSDDSRVEPLPRHWKALRDLHVVRNPAQHGGSTPDADTTRRHVANADLFLSEAVFTVFGVELHEISMAHIVQWEEPRGYLVVAQNLIRQEDFNAAAFEVAKAHGAGRQAYRLALAESHRFRLGPHLWSDGFPQRRYSRDPLEQAYKEMARIARVVEDTRFGVSVDEILRYAETARGAVKGAGSSVWMLTGRAEVRTREVAQWQLNYVARLLHLMGRHAAAEVRNPPYSGPSGPNG